MLLSTASCDDTGPYCRTSYCLLSRQRCAVFSSVLTTTMHTRTANFRNSQRIVGCSAAVVLCLVSFSTPVFSFPISSSSTPVSHQFRRRWLPLSVPRFLRWERLPLWNGTTTATCQLLRRSGARQVLDLCYSHRFSSLFALLVAGNPRGLTTEDVNRSLENIIEAAKKRKQEKQQQQKGVDGEEADVQVFQLGSGGQASDAAESSMAGYHPQGQFLAASQGIGLPGFSGPPQQGFSGPVQQQFGGWPPFGGAVQYPPLASGQYQQLGYGYGAAPQSPYSQSQYQVQQYNWPPGGGMFNQNQPPFD